MTRTRPARRRSRPAAAAALAAAAGAALLLATGCSQNADSTEVATFTDRHGRACTAAVVVDSDDGDREVSALDCEYPPDGREPGRSGYSELP